MDPKGSIGADAAAVEETLGSLDALIECLSDIRRGWKAGDGPLVDAMASGFPTDTGGFEKLLSEWRRTVRHTLARVEELLETALWACGESLQERILRFLRSANLDLYCESVFGEPSTRARQTWSETGLDADVDDLVHLLRAVRRRLSADLSRSTPPDLGTIAGRFKGDDTRTRRVQGVAAELVKRTEPFLRRADVEAVGLPWTTVHHALTSMKKGEDYEGGDADGTEVRIRPASLLRWVTFTWKPRPLSTRR